MRGAAGQRAKLLEQAEQLRDAALNVCLDLSQTTGGHGVSTGWPTRRIPLLDCVAASLTGTLAFKRDALAREPIARFDGVTGETGGKSG